MIALLELQSVEWTQQKPRRGPEHSLPIELFGVSARDPDKRERAHKIDVVRRLSILAGSEGTAACLWDFSPIGNSSLDWARELFLTHLAFPRGSGCGAGRQDYHLHRVGRIRHYWTSVPRLIDWVLRGPRPRAERKSGSRKPRACGGLITRTPATRCWSRI